MTLDDRLERAIDEAARDYHRPPSVTPREEMWQAIVARRAVRRRRADLLRPALRWSVGIAAVLAVGVAIGRWSATTPAAPRAPSTLAYHVAAAQYLTRTEALLTGFRAETRSGGPADQLAAQARDLLATTRLMLDCPAGKDPRLKGLLEDLEAVLAQIAQLPPGGDREDVQLINQGLEQRNVLLRLRTANPSGPGPVRTQGAL